VDRPNISFALSSGNNNVVDIGAALSVTVTSTDNFGVGYVFTRISNGAQVLAIDTATIKPTQKSVVRTVPIPLGTVAKGDQLTIRATAADGATNETTVTDDPATTDCSVTSLEVSTRPFSKTIRPTDWMVAAMKIGIAPARARANCPVNTAPKAAANDGRAPVTPAPGRRTRRPAPSRRPQATAWSA